MASIIRLAQPEDSNIINEIADGDIENTAINLDNKTWNRKNRLDWMVNTFNQPNNPYKLLVLQKNKQVTGFTYNTPFKAKPSYPDSTGTSIHEPKCSSQR